MRSVLTCVSSRSLTPHRLLAVLFIWVNQLFTMFDLENTVTCLLHYNLQLNGFNYVKLLLWALLNYTFGSNLRSAMVASEQLCK